MTSNQAIFFKYIKSDFPEFHYQNCNLSGAKKAKRIKITLLFDTADWILIRLDKSIKLMWWYPWQFHLDDWIIFSGYSFCFCFGGRFNFSEPINIKWYARNFIALLIENRFLFILSLKSPINHTFEYIRCFFEYKAESPFHSITKTQKFDNFAIRKKTVEHHPHSSHYWSKKYWSINWMNDKNSVLIVFSLS